MPADPLPPIPPTPPAPAEFALLRAEIAAARQSPWLASLFMRRLDALGTGLAELRDCLAELPRRLRRRWLHGWGRRWAQSLAAAALVMALASWTALAGTDATITVDPGGSGCTLSAAITAANTNAVSGSCPAGSGPDTIDFAGANGSYGYTSALPAVTTAVTIQGNGNTTIERTGGPDFSVLRVTGGGSLAIENATITGGSAVLGGGGIYVDASTLTVTNATISGNSAFYGGNGGGIFARSSTVGLTSTTISSNSAAIRGGGIYANASAVSLEDTTISGNSAISGGGIDARLGSTVSVTGATISGNSARDDGGGIFASASTVGLTSTTISGNSSGSRGGGIFADGRTLTLIKATISGNSAGGDGGGILTESQALLLTNATISGNSSGGDGGGIFVRYGVAALTHATITGNSAAVLIGGLRSYDGSVTIRSSIVAGQAVGLDCDGDPFINNGHNIESATSCSFTATGDQQNVTAAQLNLGALALNAPGSTQTHALGAASFALNEIPPGTNGCGTMITDDQRGVARPQGSACDVGAYELEVAAPTAAQVTHFAAAPDPTGRIRITWETASEVDLTGFRVERTVADPPSPHGPPSPPRPQSTWTAIGNLIPAHGSATGGARYAAVDAPGVGSFAYRLVVVNANGPPSAQVPVGAVVRVLRAFLPWAGLR